MNHHNDVGASSAWTLSSSSSWGTVHPSGYPESDPSFSQSWGTDRSKTPFGSVSNFSLGPQGSFASGSPSWGSQATLVHGVHPSSSMSYPASPLSTASTMTLVNAPVGVQGLSHIGYPTFVSGPSPRVHLHPSLHDGRLGIDFTRAPPAHNNLLVSAFNPTITYMEVRFEGFPHWTLRAHTAHPLTIWDILTHIYHHLQAVDVEATSANHRAPQSITCSRDQNYNSGSHSSGGRRINALGRRTKLAGFKPTGGANGWIACFSF
ncbi:hypothetical protein CVT25_006104 [Psilocybe cyanescens]|uniref:DUF6699 domain-containing protein n=1 Tax=Psilocybe cyanescens TaxID=93625 RepID=A0A409XIK6_PSICY|nr:hypothetical protein CVT25_006104 [Psilocybe cyanescens]